MPQYQNDVVCLRNREQVLAILQTCDNLQLTSIFLELLSAVIDVMLSKQDRVLLLGLRIVKEAIKNHKHFKAFM
jgi:hypothetical protein